MRQAGPPRISVVIPTYRRCESLIALIKSLTAQKCREPFEVVVAIDGSADGSAEALRALEVPFPLTVLEQTNQGSSVARNNGAACASGDIVLFIDDDMEAHPRLLAEHVRSHRDGADVVLGHFPLHPQSPRNLLSNGVRQWVDDRLVRLVNAPKAPITFRDMQAAQLSVRRDAFEAVGGFSTSFTTGVGSYGNEDIEFGYRLTSRGYMVVFNPSAITWQRYVVGPDHFLRQWRQAGRADVAFVRQYPEQMGTLFNLDESGDRLSRMLWRPVVAAPWLTSPLTAVLRRLALALFPWGTGHGRISRHITRLFHQVQKIEYWSGVRDAGGIRPRAQSASMDDGSRC